MIVVTLQAKIMSQRENLCSFVPSDLSGGEFEAADLTIPTPVLDQR